MVEIPKVQFYHFSSNAFLVTLIVEFYFCFLLEVVFFFFFFPFLLQSDAHCKWHRQCLLLWLMLKTSHM